MSIEDRLQLWQEPPVRSIEWVGDENGCPVIIDQTLLPHRVERLRIETAEQMWEAIRRLRIRGAPAIGIAAAMGLVVGVRPASQRGLEEFRRRVDEVADYLATSRPTAVNLFWALERMRRVARDPEHKTAKDCFSALYREALAIRNEDAQLCRRIAEHGAPLMPDSGAVLTHCNTGGLATAELGTALGVITAAWCQGKEIHVYVDETRPLLQGARLTCWELKAWGIPHTLLCDNAAAFLMSAGKVQAVIVGADRIAANGDVANKIGTYGLAVLARHHGVPFYVAAPYSTFDLNLPNGGMIPIEERSEQEVTEPFGKLIAPAGTGAYNPAFDVTPADLITAIITDRGVIQPVTSEQIERFVASTC